MRRFQGMKRNGSCSKGSLILALAFISWNAARAQQTGGVAKSQKAPASASMSFSEVARYALEHNATIAASRTSIDVARAGRDAAHGLRYPVLAAGGSVFANSVAQPPFFFYPSSSTGMGVFTSPFLATSNLTYAGTLTLPLYSGGRISSQVRMGDVATQIAQLQLRQTRDDLILNLASAYYGITRFQRVIAARQRAVDALRANARITSQLVDVGREPRVDLLRVQTRLANVRQQLIEARNMLDVTYYVLDALMGISDISYRVVPTEKLEFTPTTVNLLSAVQQALGTRPLVLERERQVRLAEAQLGLARSQLRPMVGVQGLLYAGGTSLSHGLNQGIVLPVGTRQQNDWGVQAFVSVPIFNRNLKDKERQASYVVARSRSQLDAARLSVQREVEAAYENLQNTAARVDAAKTALASARESLRIENLLVNVGKGIISDLLLAQADSLTAEENYIGAQADYKVAQVALQHAIGNISIP